MANLNLNKIVQELSQWSDLKHLKKEAQKLSQEIANFDIHSHLNPNARQKIKRLEKRYKELMKSIAQAQKQFDRDFNRTLRYLTKTNSRSYHRYG